MNKNILYYVMAAILGGFVKDLNCENNKVSSKKMIITGVTSVCIGIVVGYSIEFFTKSVELAIATSALGGVYGYATLTFLIKNVKSKVNSDKVDRDSKDK